MPTCQGCIEEYWNFSQLTRQENTFIFSRVNSLPPGQSTEQPGAATGRVSAGLTCAGPRVQIPEMDLGYFVAGLIKPAGNGSTFLLEIELSADMRTLDRTVFVQPRSCYYPKSTF